jgi:hypothetical protein
VQGNDIRKKKEEFFKTLVDIVTRWQSAKLTIFL